MTRLMIRAAMLAVAAAALSACATTPQYAARPGYTPPEPLEAAKPQYPIRRELISDVEPGSAPVGATVETAAAAPTPAPVESRPLAQPAVVSSSELAPVAGASAPPAGEERASEPARMPPPAAPAPAASVERAGDLQRMPSAAPPAYVPPAPQSPPRAARPAPARYIAAGRVVDGAGLMRSYTVRKGDHIDSIARNLGTTRKVIVDENKLKAPYNIHPGQTLRVPVDKAYSVMAGDTLAAVSRRFGVSVGELAGQNHISSRAALRPGQKLGLPDGFRDRGPIKLPPTQVAMAPPPPATPYAPPPRRTESYAPVAAPRPVESRPPSAYPYASAPAATAPTTPPASRPYETAINSPPSTSRPIAPAPTAAPPATRTYAAGPSQGGYRAAPPPPGQARPPLVDSTPTPSEGEIATAARGRFLWPVRGEVISAFGVKGVGRRNDGLDIRAPQGTLVRSAAGGEVVYAGDQVPGFGNLVLVKHTDGWVTAYAHLDKVAVQMRQQVTQGQELGQVGASGGVPEPQLHFEVRYAPTPADKAKPVDPVLVLPRL